MKFHHPGSQLPNQAAVLLLFSWPRDREVEKHARAGPRSNGIHQCRHPGVIESGHFIHLVVGKCGQRVSVFGDFLNVSKVVPWKNVHFCFQFPTKDEMKKQQGHSKKRGRGWKKGIFRSWSLSTPCWRHAWRRVVPSRRSWSWTKSWPRMRQRWQKVDLGGLCPKYQVCHKYGYPLTCQKVGCNF